MATPDNMLRDIHAHLLNQIEKSRAVLLENGIPAEDKEGNLIPLVERVKYLAYLLNVEKQEGATHKSNFQLIFDRFNEAHDYFNEKGLPIVSEDGKTITLLERIKLFEKAKDAENEKAKNDFDKISKMYVEAENRASGSGMLNVYAHDILDDLFVPRIVDVRDFIGTPFADEDYKEGTYAMSGSVVDRIKYLAYQHAKRGITTLDLKMKRVEEEYTALQHKFNDLQKDFERLHDIL